MRTPKLLILLLLFILGFLAGRYTDLPKTFDPCSNEKALLASMQDMGDTDLRDCRRKDTVCCETTAYDQMTLDQLKYYACIYRDLDWPLTSQLYSNPAYSGYKTYSPTTVYEEVAEIPGYADVDGGPFDARFMDIPITELQNYLCRIKNSNEYQEAGTGGSGAPNTIRFYYIKYPTASEEYYDEAIDPSFPGRQNAAGDEIDEQREYYELTHPGVPLPESAILSPSTIANHNIICPPFTGCYEKGDPNNTIAMEIDLSGPCVVPESDE